MLQVAKLIERREDASGSSSWREGLSDEISSQCWTGVITARKAQFREIMRRIVGESGEEKGNRMV
jgi:hypothetical protein